MHLLGLHRIALAGAALVPLTGCCCLWPGGSGDPLEDALPGGSTPLGRTTYGDLERRFGGTPPELTEAVEEDPISKLAGFSVGAQPAKCIATVGDATYEFLLDKVAAPTEEDCRQLISVEVKPLPNAAERRRQAKTRWGKPKTDVDRDRDWFMTTWWIRDQEFSLALVMTNEQGSVYLQETNVFCLEMINDESSVLWTDAGRKLFPQCAKVAAKLGK